MKANSVIVLLLLTVIKYSSLWAQPTVGITSGVLNPTNATSFTVTITFNESVDGFEVGDIVVDNCTLSSFNSTANPVFTVSVTPTSDGLLKVDVPAAVCTATTGGASNQAATTFSVTYDSQSPTVAITSSETSPTNANPIPISISFNESVTGFTVDDLTVTNGTAGNFSGSGTTYTADVTSSGQGTVSVDISAGVVTDDAGNGNSAATTFSITFDSQSPTVSITSTEISPTSTNPIPVSITFNESVSGFAIGDITVTNGSASNLSGSGANYTADITPSGQGIVSVDISAGVATDDAGNGNLAATTFSITFDSQSPTVAITSAETNPTNANPIPVSITFNESVSGFAIGDVVVTNGSASNLSGSGANYTADIIPSGIGTVKVDVAAGVATDAAGNGNTAATQFSIDFDNAGPSVSVTTTANNPTNVSPIPITITFSKSVTGFVVGDISVTNGTAGSFSGSGTTYTANITPSTQGTVVVNVNANVAQDNASNGNTAATPLSITYDSNAPTVSSVSVPDNGIYTESEVMNFTVNYNENVYVNTTGGTPYITIDVGSSNNKPVYYSGGTGTSSIVFSYTVQAGDYDNNGINVDNTIALSSGTIKDLAGNNASTSLSSIGSTSSVWVDGNAPVVENVTVPSNGYYKAGQNLIFTVKYDKVITVNTSSGTPYINVTLNTGGTVRAYYSGGSTTMYLTFSYTVVSGNLDLDGIVLGTTIVRNSGTLKYGSTNAYLTLNNIASTAGVFVDAVLPVISSALVTAGSYGIGSVIPVTITADASNYIADGAVTVNGESAIFVNMGDKTYKAFYTVGASSFNRNAVSTLPISITLKDNAGNTTPTTSATVSGGTLSINTKPTVRITGSTSKCDYPWQTVPITFTFTGVKPYTFTYNDGTSNHNVTSHDADTYVINVVSGTYTLVSLTDQTGNTTNAALENATITINPVTTPTFNVTASPYNATEGKDELSKYVSPTGGTFWGSGVGTDGYFYPSLIDVSGGAVTCNLKYSYTNGFGCKDTVAYDVIVRNDSVYFKDLASFYCASPTTPTSIVSVEGLGTVTWESFDIAGTTPGVEWTSLGGHRYQIDPKLISTGNHVVTYIYTENGKTFTITDNIDIVRISNPVDFNVLNSAYCSNDDEVLLIAENNYPEAVKGHFSGPISGFYSAENSSLATLTPAAAPKKVKFNISYYFETKEGCISPTKIKETQINTVPSVSFTLRDNYNYAETPISLVGDPVGGNFYGEVIELNKILNPSLINQSRIDQDIDITYSYTDTETGCVGDTTLQTKVHKANAPILNLNAVYCFDDLTFNITCDPGIGSDFVFSSKKNALTQLDDHTAQYSLALAGEGVDTVWYSYKINSTPYEIAKAVFIDSIGNVDFEIDPKYCNHDDPIIIIGQHRVMNGTNEYSYTGTSGAFQPNPIYATLSPKLENPGNYSINYKFISEKGCYKEINKNVQINPVSIAAFEVIGTCPNINQGVQFVNNSNEPVGDIVKWKWTFEDDSSILKSPVYAFKTAGLKTVVLTATTEAGKCKTQASVPLTIGYTASADFKWDRECFTGDSIQFSDNSSGGAVVSSLWKNDQGDILSDKRNFKYKFAGVGNYAIELLIETVEGCKDSITKEISIQKFFDFNSNKFYLDNFDGTTQDWIAKGLTDSDYSSWTFGTPSGTYFNSAASGLTSWYTNTGLANQIKESSQVLSPCFDLRGLEKPMVKLNIWSAPERGRDGAVLQYSVDGGKTWSSSKVVGAENEGINWYDPVNVSSKPAGQSAGWSSVNPQEGWKSARHNLDMIKDSSNVRFRIVYANDAINISPFNGFAFDDFWIGERQQMVLTEAFTNVDNQFDAVNLFLKDFEKEKQRDIVSIHYHTSIPVDDPFYNYYSAGTMSRGFYYGAANAPYVYSNGKNPSSISTSETIKEYIRVVDEKTLVDPILTITQITGNVGNIRVDLTANRDINGESLVLYCALVKDSIVTNGGEYFYNVLRKFYPSPSGVSLPTANWLSGQTRNQEISISFDNSAEVIDAKLVLFVQNTSTNAIYQTAVYSDLQTVLSIKPIDISKNVDLFPNPASDNVIVQCTERIDRIAIFDITGRIIDEYAPGQEQYSLPLRGYKSGIYLVKGFTKNGQFVKKLVKQ